MHPDRTVRLVRGFVAGGFATLVAAVSHALAGGAIGPLGVGVGLFFAGFLGMALTSRRPSRIRMGVSVAVSQLAFHALFSLLGGPGAVEASGSHHHEILTLVGPTAHDHTDGWMWLAHAAAAVATILFLARAEASVWALVVLAARRVVHEPGPVPEVPIAGPARVPAAAPRPLHPQRPLDVAPRRGPPVTAHP